MKKALFLQVENKSTLDENLNVKKYVYNISNKKILRNEITEIIKLIDKQQIDTLLCSSELINVASRILWQSKNLKRYILSDTDTPTIN